MFRRGFISRNKAGTRLKLLVWDGNGVWLCQRRLHRGGFALTPAQWEWLVAGVALDAYETCAPWSR
nr:transposase [Methylomagnum ishizawai]